MSDATPETLSAWQRFCELYGTQERIEAHWQQWIATQSELSAGFLEKAVTDQAERESVPVETVKKRLVLEKLVEDRGVKFVERFLREHDRGSKALQPLVLPRKKRP